MAISSVDTGPILMRFAPKFLIKIPTYSGFIWFEQSLPQNAQSYKLLIWFVMTFSSLLKSIITVFERTKFVLFTQFDDPKFWKTKDRNELRPLNLLFLIQIIIIDYYIIKLYITIIFKLFINMFYLIVIKLCC